MTAAYVAHASLKPRGLRGISEDQIDQHWTLYEGYVKNANGLLDAAGAAEPGSRAWAELKRRAAFEINGMVLHELYFGNLASGRTADKRGGLSAACDEVWGSMTAWREDLARTAGIRGIGWAVLYRDPAVGRLFNWWIGDHDLYHPAGWHPLLVLDVWEHAYMVDHGADGRDAYVKAFFDNVAWDVVERRFSDSHAGRTPARY
jgi:Fe-Mn family superoxide dismutase